MALSVQSKFRGQSVRSSRTISSIHILIILIFSLAALNPQPVLAQTGSGPDVQPAATALAGQLVISEFRLRGPNGANNEFIEIYNRIGAPHTVQSASGSGYGVAASDGITRFTIPNGTVIPAGGFYLGVNSVAYSLSAYPAGNGSTATGDATWTTDIPDNAGIALFNNNTGGAAYNFANRLDAVGSNAETNPLYREGAGYPALASFSIEFSLVRDSRITIFKDTNNNAADFLFMDTNASQIGMGQRLGAPAPENASSPIFQEYSGDILLVDAIDSDVGLASAPNTVHDPTSDPAHNALFGKLIIRRKLTNTSGQPITRLRIRIRDLTVFPSQAGTADLRPMTSSDTVVLTSAGNVTVKGTTLEQPPSQPNGGGFNSSLSVNSVTLANPLAAGASIYVQLVFGIQQQGCERVFTDVRINWNSCSGTKIYTSAEACNSIKLEGISYPIPMFMGLRVWNDSNSTVLLDSYENIGKSAGYVLISADGTFSISGAFPFQAYGANLRARIYRAPLQTYGSWDGTPYLEVNFTCNQRRTLLPTVLR